MRGRKGRKRRAWALQPDRVDGQVVGVWQLVSEGIRSTQVPSADAAIVAAGGEEVRMRLIHADALCGVVGEQTE